ncbi:MAG: alpha/beta hydrolase family protein [Sediminibacterium sp.]|nr:alpha/beta hydrolase family protein [Sediminibacterium sp.]
MKWLCVIGYLFLTYSATASVDTIQVYSNSMHKPIKVVVVKPLSYNPTQPLPVVYLLHGHGGNYGQWLRDAPILNERATEMNALLVMPDGGYNSWYFDSPIDPAVRYETFISKELVTYIDSAFATKKNKNSRAITGLSMGGHGALYLAIRHKDIFGTAGSICGGVDIRPFPENWEIASNLGVYKDAPNNWEKNTVINLVETLVTEDLQLIIDCGYDDFFLPVNRSLHQKLLRLKIAHSYTERPGNHSRAYWSNSIEYQLLYFKNWFAQN